MFRRYIDISSKKFIKRENIKYFFKLNLYFLLYIFILIILYCISYKNKINIHDILFYHFITSVFASFIIFYLISYLFNIKNKTEMQNSFFSSSLKSFTDFFIIINDEGKIIYCDNKSKFNLQNIIKHKLDKFESIFDIFKGDNIKNTFNDTFHKKNDFNFFIYNRKKIFINSLDKPVQFFCVYNFSPIIKHFEFIFSPLLNHKNIFRICTDENGYIISKFNNNININNFHNHISSIFTPKSEKKGILHIDQNNVKSVVYNIENKFFNQKKLISYFFQEINISDLDELYYSPIMICNTDFNGNILSANKLFEDNFGNDITNIISVMNYKKDVRLSNLSNPLTISLKNGNNVKIYHLILHNMMTFYLIDNSELIYIQHQLSQSQKVSSIGQLAGGIAHDFNNILTGILGFCDLLIEKNENNKNIIGEIIEIRNNAQRGTDLVGQIMSFARKKTLKPKICNINTILFNTTKFLSQVIGENIKLDIRYDKNLGFVKIDNIHFQQIIINIVINSKDALEGVEKAFVKIKTSNKSIKKEEHNNNDNNVPSGEYILVTILDNGLGIKREFLDKIFNPFFTTKNIGKGTGLGLSTVYGLVKQMNGYIKVESNISIGTTFYIYFPRTYEISAIELDNNNSNNKYIENNEITNNKNGITIMIVEDEYSVRLLLKKFLEKYRYLIITTESSKEAVEYFKKPHKKQCIDLIISDVIMPELNGPEMIKRIYEIDNNINVLFISGYSDDLLKDKNIPVNFQHIAKPFAMKEMLQKIKEMTEKKIDLIHKE